MMERNKYVNRDNLCAKAIEGHKETSSILNWIILNAKLFNAISIQPKGLPRITALHFQGEAFINIKKITQLYHDTNSLYL